MRWWKRSNAAEILRLVRVNDRIQIELGHGVFLSRVEDIRSESLVIGAPVDDGDVLTLFPSTEVVVKVFLPEGVRRFSARVKRMYSGRVPVVEIERFSNLGILQRRKYLRAAAKLPMHFRVEKKKGSPGRWCEGTTIDMSIGGLQIAENYMTSELEPGDFVEMKMSMPDKTEIQAACRVVRVNKSGRNRFAVEFAEIQPEAQGPIARYVEKKWLESEADRRRYVRCKVPISVQYRQADGPICESSSHDISTGGLRMAVGDANFIAGETLDLAIELPLHKKLKAEGVVVWPGDAKQPGLSEIGVKFTKMDHRSRDTLAKFLSTVQRGETELKAA